MTKKLTFCFDEEMIETALIANGWETGWNSEMWVHKNESVYYASYSKKEAFAKLLYKCNLVPKNVEECWNNETF
jgi:hypothetical protein